MTHTAYNKTFNTCVKALDATAKLLDPLIPGGMDYVKINVIGFCILLPAILIASLGLNAIFLLGLL